MDVVILIALGTLSRIVPHPANFTAVGGLALFSGARLSLKKAALIVVTTMFFSDLILGFHSVMWATYGSMLLAVLLGRVLRTNRSIRWIAGIILSSSVLFYFITNFAVWAVSGSMYPKTLAGLLASYIAALPFFRNSLAGDLFYTSVFFGMAEVVALIKRRYHAETMYETLRDLS